MTLDSPDVMNAVKTVSGKLLFRFAIITDTHIRLDEDGHLTPWKGQAKGLARATAAVSRISAANPSFLVHLGDAVQPLPHVPTHVRTVALAHGVFKNLAFPVHFTPGNHDIGDKFSLTTNAHVSDAFSLEQYEKSVGKSFRSFDYAEVHFIILNMSLMGSGLPMADEQMVWLKADLQAHHDRRIFLFTHYPIYMCTPTEPPLYDNIDEPARGILLALIAEHKIEAVFAGHVHNFFYHNYYGTELYSLLSTCFVRHDYAEMFSVGPADDFGRDDRAKLAWSEIEVYESGHVVHVHRSIPAESLDADPFTLTTTPKTHVKYAAASKFGVHLREPWAEPRPIAYNGPIDEYSRRAVRNDYALLALWESGIRSLRVPLADIINPVYLSRMHDLVAVGNHFRFFLGWYAPFGRSGTSTVTRARWPP